MLWDDMLNTLLIYLCCLYNVSFSTFNEEGVLLAFLLMSTVYRWMNLDARLIPKNFVHFYAVYVWSTLDWREWPLILFKFCHISAAAVNDLLVPRTTHAVMVNQSTKDNSLKFYQNNWMDMLSLCLSLILSQKKNTFHNLTRDGKVLANVFILFLALWSWSLTDRGPCRSGH